MVSAHHVLVSDSHVCHTISGQGATLLFADGETRATIFLLISADDIPEIDETLVVSLSNPSGSAAIVAEEQDQVTVVIDANDGVAGVVGLSSLSRSAVVGEGERIQLQVVRTNSVGRVQVDWQITGINASLEFVDTQGSDFFQEVHFYTHTCIGLAHKPPCLLCACTG